MPCAGGTSALWGKLNHEIWCGLGGSAPSASCAVGRQMRSRQSLFLASLQRRRPERDTGRGARALEGGIVNGGRRLPGKARRPTETLVCVR